MNKTRIGLLLAAALGVLPTTAFGQLKAKASVGAQAAAGDKGSAEASASADAKADDTATEGGGEDTGTEEAAGEGAGGGDTGGLEDICKIDPAACPTVDFDKEAKKPLNEQIFAVQQLYTLRVRRFELTPYWGFTFNDQFVNHPGPGLAINYYLWNSLAIGVNGNYYGFFNMDQAFNGNVRRAARVGVPLTEYNWSAALNITYVPIIGKFNGFGDFIFQYDAYVVAGGGLISTRPIPVFDPIYRNFEYKEKFAANAGIGLRVFFYRWLAAVMELRDYVYQEELESIGLPGQDATTRQDKSTWYGQKSWTNAVQAQLGVSFFLPTSFEYRLPK
ncbi:MAG: outer membrane beta-barrel domain-containing protein [Polyangiaceae bacterium]